MDKSFIDSSLQGMIPGIKTLKSFIDNLAEGVVVADKRGKLAFLNRAGHVPGYILDANGNVKRILHSTNVPLGLFPKTNFGCSEEIELEPGGILALLTDGITEAERPDKTEFGANRALEFIRAHRHETAQQIVTGIYQAVRDFLDGLPQLDDITAVICRSVPDCTRRV